MKKLFFLFALQLAVFTTYAGSLDNTKIKVDNANADNLIIPMPDNGYFIMSRSLMQPTLTRMNAQKQVLWSKTFDYPYMMFGVPNNLFDAGVMPDSGIYLIYGLYDTDSVSSYVFSYLTIKLNTQGIVEWSTRLTFPNDAMYMPGGIAKPQPDGSLFFVPSLTGEMAAVKLESDGSVGLSYIITADSNFYGKNPATGLEPTGNGGMIVIGKDENDPVVVCVNSNGTPAWTLHFSCGYYNRAYSVIKTNDGNYLISGYYIESNMMDEGSWLMKINPSGTILWAKRYAATFDYSYYYSSHLSGFFQMVENPDGSLTAFAHDQNGNTYYRGVIMNLDASGQQQWAYTYPVYNSNANGGSRIYRASDGALRLSTSEGDSLVPSVSSTLIDLASISDYCLAQPFTATVTQMPAVVDLSGSVAFINKTLTPATHPVIVTRDTIVAINDKALCAGVATGIREITAADISLVPNPASASETVTVKWGGNDLSVSRIMLRDVSGRLVREVAVSLGNEVSFSINGLLPGLYFAEVLFPAFQHSGIRSLEFT